MRTSRTKALLPGRLPLRGAVTITVAAQSKCPSSFRAASQPLTAVTGAVMARDA